MDELSKQLRREGLIGLAQAADHLAKIGAPGSNRVTLVRWICEGCTGRDGSRVHLEANRIGGRWVTTLQALERFLSRLNSLPGSAGSARKKQAAACA